MKLSDRFSYALDFVRETRSLPFLKDIALKRGDPYRVSLKSEDLAFDLLPGTGDWFTVVECCIRGDYASRPIELRSGDIVVDIGGNFGAAACMFSRAVGANGKVICYEPFPQSYDRIVQHLSLNDCGNVTAIRTAVGGSTRKAEISSFEKSAYNSIHASVDGRDKGEGVPLVVDVTDIRDVIGSLDRIDLLKIDCEGSEYEIFDSLRDVDLEKIRQFSIELHRVPDRSFGEIIDRLKSAGYSISGRNPITAVKHEA